MLRMITVILLMLCIALPQGALAQGGSCQSDKKVVVKHNTKCYKKMFQEKKPPFWTKIKLPSVPKKQKPAPKVVEKEEQERVALEIPNVQLPKIKMPRLRKASALDCPH